jgi:hypothetical protein
MTSLSEKLQPQIEPVANLILSFLARSPVSHQKVRCQASVTDREIFSLRGCALETPEPPRIRYDSSALDDAFRKFFKGCETSGVVLQMVEFHFFQDSAGWTYRLELETLSDHQSLEKERTILDQEIAKTMTEAAEAPWTKLLFEQKQSSASRFVAFRNREQRVLNVPVALESLLQKTHMLYKKYGRELRWPLWRVTGDPNRYDIETQMYYG